MKYLVIFFIYFFNLFILYGQSGEDFYEKGLNAYQEGVKAYQEGILTTAIKMFEEALRNYDEAEKIYKVKGTEEDLADIFANKGSVYAILGRYEEALRNYDEAEKIYKAKEMEEDLALIFQIKGAIYGDLGRYEEALRNYEEAEKIYKAKGMEEKLADIFLIKGAGYQGLGRYEEALENYKEAEKIYKTKGMKRNLAFIFQNKGFLYADLGRCEEALENYEEAEKIYKAKGMEENLADIFRMKAAVYQGLGNYEEALKSCEEAEKIYKAKGLEKNLVLIKAAIYQGLGRYEEALWNCEEAEKICKMKGTEEDFGDIFLIKSAVYTNLGRYEEALKNCEEAEKIFKAKGMEKKLAGIFQHKGVVYGELGNYEEALRNYEEAEKIFKAKGMEVNLVDILSNKGIIYSNLGRYEEALRNYEEVEKIYKAKGMEKDLANIFQNKGVVYRMLGRYEEALENYDRAEKIYKAKGMEANLAEIFRNKGLAYKFQDSLLKAISYYKKSIEILEKVRGKIRTEEIKLSAMERGISVYQDLISLLIQMEKYGEAFHYAERGRARSFLDLLGEREVDIRQGVDENLLNQERELLRKISLYQKKIIEEYSKPEGVINERLVDSLKRELSHTEEELTKLEREIKLVSPNYAALKYPEPLTLKGVQEDILFDSIALLEYIVNAEEIILFVVTKEKLNTYQIPIREETLTSWVKEFRNGIKHKMGIMPIARALYEKLINPAKEDIKGFKRLIIVPDGPLHFIPFQALVTEKREFFLCDYLISYAPSATILSEINKRRGRSKGKKELVGFAPEFDNKEYANATARGSLYRNFYEERGYHFNSLPYAQKEMDILMDLYKSAVVYKGDNATEYRAKNECGDYRIIHFATHGILDELKPMYSGVALSLRSPGEEDGFLQAYEIFNIKLNADLIVLSACQTGLGKLSKGEGIIGLSRAFMYAGSPSLIVSLWEVSDPATLLLMEYFYSNLKEGMEKDEALRLAQIKMAREVENIKYAHPFYWAPFILIGSW